MGFKGAKRSTSFAAQICAQRAAEDAVGKGVGSVRVLIKGIGAGRQTAVKGLQLGDQVVVDGVDRLRDGAKIRRPTRAAGGSPIANAPPDAPPPGAAPQGQSQQGPAPQGQGQGRQGQRQHQQAPSGGPGGPGGAAAAQPAQPPAQANR